MMMMMERVTNKELICMLDIKAERLNELYEEQTQLQQEITKLTTEMMQRGLNKLQNNT